MTSTSENRDKAINLMAIYIDPDIADGPCEELEDAITELLDECEAGVLEGKIVFTTKQLATLLKKTRQEQRQVCRDKRKPPNLYTERNG